MSRHVGRVVTQGIRAFANSAKSGIGENVVKNVTRRTLNEQYPIVQSAFRLPSSYSYDPQRLLGPGEIKKQLYLPSYTLPKLLTSGETLSETTSGQDAYTRSEEHYNPGEKPYDEHDTNRNILERLYGSEFVRFMSQQQLKKEKEVNDFIRLSETLTEDELFEEFIFKLDEEKEIGLLEHFLYTFAEKKITEDEEFDVDLFEYRFDEKQDEEKKRTFWESVKGHFSNNKFVYASLVYALHWLYKKTSEKDDLTSEHIKASLLEILDNPNKILPILVKSLDQTFNDTSKVLETIKVPVREQIDVLRKEMVELETKLARVSEDEKENVRAEISKKNAYIEILSDLQGAVYSLDNATWQITLPAIFIANVVTNLISDGTRSIEITEQQRKNILTNSMYFIINNVLLPKSTTYSGTSFDEFFMFFCNKLRPLLDNGKDCGSNTLQALDDITKLNLAPKLIDFFEESIRRKETSMRSAGGKKKTRRNRRNKASKKLKKYIRKSVNRKQRNGRY